MESVVELLIGSVEGINQNCFGVVKGADDELSSYSTLHTGAQAGMVGSGGEVVDGHEVAADARPYRSGGCLLTGAR